MERTRREEQHRGIRFHELVHSSGHEWSPLQNGRQRPDEDEFDVVLDQCDEYSAQVSLDRAAPSRL
jgi:hypothetical protein